MRELDEQLDIWKALQTLLGDMRTAGGAALDLVAACFSSKHFIHVHMTACQSVNLYMYCEQAAQLALLHSGLV